MGTTVSAPPPAPTTAPLSFSGFQTAPFQSGLPQMPVQPTPKIQAPTVQPAIAPPAPPSVGNVPITPEFRRIEAVESGGRQFGSDGAPLQPPKFIGNPDAPVGVGQIRPSTAKEMLASKGIQLDWNRLENDKDYNEQVSQMLHDSLKVKYFGNGIMANAAYNSGTGTVDNLKKKYGVPGQDISPEDWASHLPQETQAYLYSTGAIQGKYSATETKMPFDVKGVYANMQEKMFGAMKEGNEELSALKTSLDKLNQPPPHAVQTPPEQIWGSLAMAVAAFGGLLTHTPVATAMNAMSGVLDAFHKGDMEKTKQHMDEWKAAQDTIMQVAQMRAKMYEDALKRLAEAPQEASAMMAANAAALQDTAVQDALRKGDPLMAAAIVTSGVVAAQHMGQEADKVQQSKQAQMALHQLQIDQNAAERAGDSAKVAEIKEKIQQQITLMVAGSPAALTRIGLGNEPKPGTTAQSLETEKAQVKADHPDWNDAQVLEQANSNLAKSKQPSISDDAAMFIAERVAMGDEKALTGLARSAANITKVSDALGQLKKEGKISALELTDRVVGLNAYQAGERTLANRTVNMEVAANEAKQFAPLVVQLSDKVPRSEFPTLNKYTLEAMAGSGNTDVVRFGQAANALIYSYAKFLNPTGIPTDADKAKSAEILSTAWSHNQIKAAVDQIMFEIQAGQKGIQQTHDESKARHDASVGGGPPKDQADPALKLPALPPPPAVGTVTDGYRFKGGNPADMSAWEKVQ